MGLFSWLKKRREQRDSEPSSHSPPETAEVSVSAPRAEPRRRLSYRGANLQGIGSRSGQEDSFTFVNLLDVSRILERGLLAAVADGMGGMQGGKAASETAIASVKSAFSEFDMHGDIPSQLETAVVGANAEVYSLLHGTGGTTLVLCVFYDEKMYLASVGDSFVFLKRGKMLYRLNREQNVWHSRCLEALSGGTADRSAADSDREGHALSQFLGMDALDDIDLMRRPLQLLDGDVLMLCSDGVGGVLSEQTVLEIMSLSSPQIMCTAIEQSIANAAVRAQDNYTALIVECKY